MSTKAPLSFRNRYSKYLLIWAFVAALFCGIGPTGFSTQVQQKAPIASVIGVRQWVGRSQSYYKIQRTPLKASIEAGLNVLHAVALRSYNSKVNVLFNHNKHHLSLFEPFRFFVIPKIIPPGIDS